MLSNIRFVALNVFDVHNAFFLSFPVKDVS